MLQHFFNLGAIVPADLVLSGDQCADHQLVFDFGLAIPQMAFVATPCLVID